MSSAPFSRQEYQFSEPNFLPVKNIETCAVISGANFICSSQQRLKRFGIRVVRKRILQNLHSKHSFQSVKSDKCYAMSNVP